MESLIVALARPSIHLVHFGSVIKFLMWRQAAKVCPGDARNSRRCALCPYLKRENQLLFPKS